MARDNKKDVEQVRARGYKKPIEELRLVRYLAWCPLDAWGVLVEPYSRWGT